MIIQIIARILQSRTIKSVFRHLYIYTNIINNYCPIEDYSYNDSVEIFNEYP